MTDLVDRLRAVAAKVDRDNAILITRTEARKILGISHATMWRWCDAGKLPTYDNGMVDHLDVLRLQEQLQSR